MPRYAPNRLPLTVPRRYFELRRGGLKGAAAAHQVGVSVSCGSVWFIKAGSMLLPDKPIDARYLTQDDRIAIERPVLPLGHALHHFDAPIVGQTAASHSR